MTFTRISITTLADALRHEIQRNHEHNPDACDGCAAAADILAAADAAVGAPLWKP